MNRNAINFVVDLVSLLALCGLTATGLILAFALSPGAGGLELWGWRRHDWGDLHYYSALVFLPLLVLHVALHWRWVWSMSCRMIGLKTDTAETARLWPRRLGGAIIAGGGLALLIGFAWFASPDAATRGGGRHNRARWRQALISANDHAARETPGGRRHRGGLRRGWATSGGDGFEQTGQGGGIETLRAGQ